MKLRLSEDLEASILFALSQGAVPPEVVDPEELSKAGRAVYQSTCHLLKSDVPPPFPLKSIRKGAVEAFGGDEQAVLKLMKKVYYAGAGKEIAHVIQAVRDKQLYVDIINTATAHLASGVMNPVEIEELLKRRKADDHLVPVSDLLSEKFPDAPTGAPLDSLPVLSKATGGLYGLWAIAGEPGVGKSSLAWQVALAYVCQGPVLVYDYENGWVRVGSRLGRIFGGDLRRAKKITSRIYLRRDARSLSVDLKKILPPALVVVDQIQKLPVSTKHSREGLDKWLNRFEQLTQDGYDVLLVSEKSKGTYGQTHIGAFKGTGEIEYSATVGIQLKKVEGGEVKLYLVKNRDREKEGFLVALKKKNWMFQEVESDLGEEEEWLDRD